MNASEYLKRRIELNKLIKRETLLRNAVPILANKPWAKNWRAKHQIPMNNALRRYRRELQAIARVIGPQPAWWKPRPLRAAERIARQYANGAKATAPLRAA